MNSKLGYLVKVSLERKIKTKWFVIANILLLILIVGITNIDSIIKAFGGDFSKPTQVLVLSDENSYESFNTSFTAINDTLGDAKANAEVSLFDGSIDQAKTKIDEEEAVAVVLEADEENVLKAQVLSKSGTGAVLYQVLSTSVNSVKQNLALEKYNVSAETMALVQAPVVIEQLRINDEKSVDEMMETVMSSVFPILILPFFMLTIFLVQMIGAEINEEKTTKSMEIIISNVSPKTHFAAKLLAGNLFVLIQGVLLVLMAVAGMFIRSILNSGSDGGSTGEIGGLIEQVQSTGAFDSIGILLPIALVLMIITLVGYSLLAGILASMTTNMEDYQQIQAPTMVLLLVGYYLAMMAAVFKGSLFIQIASYLPFISALLSPTLFMLGEIALLDVIISTVVMIAVVFLLFRYGLRIYKVGILNYSSSNIWKKIFKAAKNK